MRAWNLTTRKCIWNVTAHKGFVRGISLTADGDGILSVGDDRCVRLWKLDYDMQKWTNPANGEVPGRAARRRPPPRLRGAALTFGRVVACALGASTACSRT